MDFNENLRKFKMVAPKGDSTIRRHVYRAQPIRTDILKKVDMGEFDTEDVRFDDD